MIFYQLDTEEVSDRFVAHCFVNGLEAYDGEINLGVEENMISNEGEIYFVKFIINPKEDDVEPEVIFGRSFLRMTKEIIDFGARTVTIYPDIDLFLEETEGEEKNRLPPIVCRMRKNSRNKKRAMENLKFFYQDVGTSSSTGGHITQEEAAKEAIAIRMSRKFALFEEEMPIIETMAYNDKYKKILDEVWKDKVELDGKIVKEEEDAIGGAVNKNALADTGSDINTMPYRNYETLGREDMKKVGVTTLIAKFLILDILIDRDSLIVVGRGFLHTIGGIINTLERLLSTFDGFGHQTFHAARSDIMRNAESDSDDKEDYHIKRNKFGAPIYGPKPAPYLNCNDPDERSIDLQTPDYKGSYTKEEEATGQWRTEIRLTDPLSKDTKSRYNTRLGQLLPRHIYSPCIVNWDVLNIMGYDGEIDDMLSIRLREARLDEEIFTSMAWIRAFNINEPIYAELCYEFYSTYEFDEVCVDDELQTKKITKFKLGGRAHNLTLLEFARRLGLYQAVELEEEDFNVYFEGGLGNDEHFNAQDYWVLGLCGGSDGGVMGCSGSVGEGRGNRGRGVAGLAGFSGVQVQ
uniref:Uncharacterized protein n=1 Tax=Tanacetum cinerariifolium TaxID=118510 RepID=A0A6L2ME09_TANCI|nr:hypothetical protein [Tanacetum cinerariifolium]